MGMGSVGVGQPWEQCLWLAKDISEEAREGGGKGGTHLHGCILGTS